MTLFFNNDGSILITTPIIIQILSFLKLKTKECLPYLFAGALIATASSAPIAVSNLANLIALKIVGLEINDYVLLMFVPTLVGIIVLGALVYFYFKHDIPRTIPSSPDSYNTWLEHNTSLNYKQGHRAIRQHPLMETVQEHKPMDFALFRLSISIVILTRAGLFLGSSNGIPMEMIALAGAVLLIGVRWKWMRIGWQDVIKKCPWHILIFAFSIYVVIHALHLIGLTTMLVNLLQLFIAQSHIHAIMITGGLATLIANLFNNIPAVMIGTITLTEMGLDFEVMQLAYLANIIGSDLGALISPMGTLATLLWMFILKNNRIPISWGKYFKVVVAVVPISTVVTLFSLYFWTRLFF